MKRKIYTSTRVFLPRTKPFLLVLLPFILITSIIAQSNREVYSEVRVYLNDRSDLIALQEAGLGLDHIRFQGNFFDAVLNSRQIETLQAAGKSYDILIEDLSAYYNQNVRMDAGQLKALQKEMKTTYNIEGFEFGSMGGYYTYSEVVTELDSMRLLYPNLVSAKESIGQTIEGREMWMVRISDNPDVNEGEPEVLYTALHHAREPQSMATVVYFMYYLLENYGSDPEVTYLVNNRELYFVPVLNADGYVYNQMTDPNGGGFWRKNRRNNGGGSFGVDLNRNYGFQWGFNNSGSSPTPGAEDYRGTAPFSEPETQNIRDFCEGHNFKLALNYHTSGDLLIYPWGYINAFTPDHPIFLALAQDMTQFNGYTHGNSSQLLYDVNGGSDDWMYGEQATKGKIFSMTPEVGPSFWPSPSLIYPLAQENIYPNLRLAWGEGVILADSLDPLPPSNQSAYSDYTTPTSMQLTWDDPTSLANGDPLAPGEFTIEIERDGAFITSVNGGVQQYNDTGLNDGQLYTYNLYANVIATDSTSEVVGVAWIAGGSPIPAAPENLACNATTTSAALSWDDPTTQADGTPLDDLDHLNVYRDGALIATVVPGTQTYTDTPAPGFVYTYTVTAVDNEIPPNESAPSNAVESFVGSTPRFLVWVGPDASGQSAESGDSLFAALAANGESAFLTNNLFEFGNDLGIYEGIFVVLGIFSNNHVIGASDPEGPALQTYLQNGGNLYLEGGDCFNYDPGTGGYDITPWFGLGSGSDGSGDLSGVIGLNALSAFSFAYAGENNWMDELNPVSSTPVWQNNANSDISGVYYTGFGSGKSIGVVPSFGGLVNSSASLNPERPIAKAISSEKTGSTGVKIRPPREEAQTPFAKKAAYYPELKTNRKQNDQLFKVTPGGIEILANNKVDLMAAYLGVLFGISNAPQINVSFTGISIELFAGELSTAILSIFNSGSSAAPDLEFSIVENPLVDWLSVSPDSGSVPGGQSMDITLSFDATALTTGVYTTTLKITSNDTANAEVNVSVTLRIVSAASIAVSPDSISFDTTFVNQQKTAALMVYNQGGVDMSVSDILSTHAYFSAAPAQFTVTPGDSQSVTVTFAPAAIGNYSAMLKIASNDPLHDTLTVNVNGIAEMEVGIGDAPQLPAEFALSPNFPNPFNPATTISYQLPQAADVKLAIYNVLGQQVRTLISGQMPAGYHRAVWDGRNEAGVQVGSGVYIYIFEAGDFRKVQKMVLMK